jgi:pyruvate dehydrogenase E2 component (dihydrolipoamide acetyltransferase)
VSAVSERPSSAETVTRDFKLPDLGEGLTESEIVSWRVAVGDEVRLNQVIGEVETAKAVVELPSPFTGRVVALLAEPGQVVAVGTPIATFEVADQKEPAQKEPAQKEPAQKGPGQGQHAQRREPNLVGYGALPESSGHPTRKARTWASTREAAVAEERPVATTRPRSTPPVRKLAKDLGVDLDSVDGSGPQGLITRDDVLERVGTPEPVPQEHPAEEHQVARHGRETRTPVRGVRKATAAAMVSSAFTAPHASEFLTIDVTPAMELLTRLRAGKAFSELKLTPMTLAAKAVLIALRRHPELNAHWDDATQEIVQYHYVNLGIAAATPRGLLVPNVKDADAMDLAQLAAAISSLVDSAREGRTTPGDLAGGTITITNIGVFGVDAGTPILNPGEAAILALGQVRRMPWEYHGEIALRQVVTLSLSFDHRLVDGEQASRFLADVGAILADPGMVLAMV